MGMTNVTFISATSVKRTSAGCYTVSANWWGSTSVQRPYEFYIVNEGPSVWCISGEQHSDYDFDQTEFKTLKEAKAELVTIAEIFSEGCIENMVD